MNSKAELPIPETAKATLNGGWVDIIDARGDRHWFDVRQEALKRVGASWTVRAVMRSACGKWVGNTSVLSKVKLVADGMIPIAACWACRKALRHRLQIQPPCAS